MGPRLRISCLVAAVLVGVVGCAAESGTTQAVDADPAAATPVATPVAASSSPAPSESTGQPTFAEVDSTTSPAAAPVREARTTQIERLVAVAADGRPAVGWSVTDAGTPSASGAEDCSGPSPAAVTAGVFVCGGTANGSNACWPGPDPGTMVCLQDLWSRNLFVLNDFYPGVSTGPADEPEPIGLELENGLRCPLRKGGAWPGRDPDPSLTAAYGCSDGTQHSGTALTAVWVAPDTPAVDRSTSYWTVQVGGTDGPLQTVGVAKAYFVAAE